MLTEWVFKTVITITQKISFSFSITCWKRNWCSGRSRSDRITEMLTKGVSLNGSEWGSNSGSGRVKVGASRGGRYPTPTPVVPRWSALVYVLPPVLVNPIYGFIIGHMPDKSAKNSLLWSHNKNEITQARLLQSAWWPGPDLPTALCGWGELTLMGRVELTWMLVQVC